MSTIKVTSELVTPRLELSPWIRIENCKKVTSELVTPRLELPPWIRIEDYKGNK